MEKATSEQQLLMAVLLPFLPLSVCHKKRKFLLRAEEGHDAWEFTVFSFDSSVKKGENALAKDEKIDEE